MEPTQGNSGGTVGSGGEGLGGETIEIKIKTLDSQSYTIQVEKNVSMNGIFGKHFVVSFWVMVCTNFVILMMREWLKTGGGSCFEGAASNTCWGASW
jgi:hypothetical protein